MNIIEFIFNLYQKVFTSPLATCRFQPTCSQYAKEAVEEYGFGKGSYLALKRVLSCHPFSNRPIIDPIPTK